MDRTFSVAVSVFFGLALAGPLAAQDDERGPAPAPAAPSNPYNLSPFEKDFPVDLTWPSQRGLVFDRTRRQILEQIAANLQGNVRREAWQFATEFWWHAPEDAIEPLVAAMDRAFGNPALNDVVKNCVEAMGRMAHEGLEPALLRAIEHKNPVVRQAAFVSLAKAATPATLRKMGAWFQHMDFHATGAWVTAVHTRLGDDGVKILRDLMASDPPIPVRDQITKRALLMPPAKAASILESRWSTAMNEFKATIAGVFHAAGDARGTTWLREALESEDLVRLVFALRQSTIGDPGELRPLLLKLSTHARPDVRLELAKALRPVAGDDVTDVYEVLAMPEEAQETKTIALRELTRRGRGKVVGALLGELESATGTRLTLLLQQLAESGDPRAVPVLLARSEKAAPEQRRPFLQALATNRSTAATEALLQMFEGPEQVVARGYNGAFTTLNYIPTLLLNTRGAEEPVLSHFAKLAPDDWRRRAALMPTLVGIATDREDPAIKERFLAPVRAILFDQAAMPQLRVLALNLLSTRWLGVDDALRLKNGSQDDPPALRALFHDFLNEYF